MLRKVFKNNSAGDTIVEVMLALAILGLVLGGAYIVVNHSTLNERRAQERGIALQLAQAQIESMKQFASVSSLTSANGSPFCLGLTTSSNSVTMTTTTTSYTVPTRDDPCYVDSSGNPSLAQPLFHLSEQLKGSATIQSCSANYNCVFQVQVNWPDVDGTTMDVLTLYYKLYS